MQALSTRNARSCLASSSSCDGEDHMLAYKSQWAKDAEFRGVRDRVKEMEND